MPLRLYRIKDWSKHYETHESRKLKRLDWVAMPNKHDGLGFRLLAAEKDAPTLLAAWTLLVQIASRGDKDNRGKLERDGRPLTAAEISLMTGFPAKIFERAFTFFTQERIGWLVAEQWQTDLLLPADEPAESPDASASAAARTPIQDRTGQDRTNKTPERAAKPAPALAAVPDSLKTDEFQTAWDAWIAHRSEIRHPLKPTSAAATLSALDKIGPQRAALMIRFTIFKGWRGLREPTAEDMKQFQPLVGTNVRKAITEPRDWKAFLNHEYPDSVYSANGTTEAHEWSDLPRDTQQWLIGEMRKKGAL